MNNKKSNEQKKYNFTEKAEKDSFAALGQYVPIHKTQKKENKIIKNFSNPFQEKKEKTKPTFDIYDGDYISNPMTKNIGKNINKSIWQNIKDIFFSLPLINILYLKSKQKEIKETILKLDIMSSDIDNYSKFLKNRYILNEEKYQKICSELNKTAKIQTKINQGFNKKI